MVIEIDEDHHNHKLSLIKDPIREVNVKEELGCTFFRIKRKSWLEDSASIIKEFINIITALRVAKNL